MSFSQLSVLKLYQSVIDETLNSSRILFEEEGLDDQLLIKLRQSWESKLIASKAIDVPCPQEMIQLPNTVDPAIVVEQDKNPLVTTIFNNSVHQLEIMEQQKIQQLHHQQSLQQPNQDAPTIVDNSDQTLEMIQQPPHHQQSLQPSNQYAPITVDNSVQTLEMIQQQPHHQQSLQPSNQYAPTTVVNSVQTLEMIQQQPHHQQSLQPSNQYAPTTVDNSVQTLEMIQQQLHHQQSFQQLNQYAPTTVDNSVQTLEMIQQQKIQQLHHQQPNQYAPTTIDKSVHQLEMIQQQEIQQLHQQSLQLQKQQKQPQQNQQQQRNTLVLPTDYENKYIQPQQQNTIVFPADYENKYYVPIQITLPTLGSYETGSAIQGNLHQSIFSSPVIFDNMATASPFSTFYLQQHAQPISIVQTVQSLQPQQQQLQQLQQDSQTFISVNGTGGVKRTFGQIDGTSDSSTSDDDKDDNIGDYDDDDDKIDNEKDQNSYDDVESLNSSDDVSDIDNCDLFEAEHIICCQFNKIIRNKNKWKLLLKDGIMNLNGYDFIFKNATGDAEW